MAFLVGNQTAEWLRGAMRGGGNIRSRPRAGESTGDIVRATILEVRVWGGRIRVFIGNPPRNVIVGLAGTGTETYIGPQPDSDGWLDYGPDSGGGVTLHVWGLPPELDPNTYYLTRETWESVVWWLADSDAPFPPGIDPEATMYFGWFGLPVAAVGQNGIVQYILGTQVLPPWNTLDCHTIAEAIRTAFSR